MHLLNLRKARITLLPLILGALVAVAGALDAAAGKGGAEPPIRLRVLSYNIHHGEGVDRKLDLARIADVIKSVEPDLVALQEVDRNVRRSGQMDQPAELARLTGLHAVFGANLSLQGGEYGNAVLSRVAARQHENHLLPSFDKGEQRGVLAVEFEFANGKEGSTQPVVFLATHLDHRADGRERLVSAKAINELATKMADKPGLLAGDFNDRPESQTLAELSTLWTSSSEKPIPTVPVARPARQIDFVLFRPRERWRVVEVRVLEEAVASDHRAILAVFELVTAPGKAAVGR